MTAVPGCTPLGPHDPRELGPFELIGVLGRGGFGTVFLGRDGGRSLAVKTVRANDLGDIALRARFVRELGVAQEVRSRYVPAVVDHDVESSLPWIATELVTGVRVDEIVGRQGIPLDRVTWLRLASGLLRALDAIHDLGVVHRDVTGGNVLLTQDGSPRVVDFGISLRPGQTRVTLRDSVVGTISYMAPERWDPDAVETPAVDVFSAGCVLALASGGRHPFQGTRQEVMARVQSGRPDLEAVPDDIRAPLESMIAVEPTRRPSAVEVLAWLEAKSSPSSTRETSGPGSMGVPVQDLVWPPPPPAPPREFEPEPVGCGDRRLGSGLHPAWWEDHLVRLR